MMREMSHFGRKAGSVEKKGSRKMTRKEAVGGERGEKVEREDSIVAYIASPYLEIFTSSLQEFKRYPIRHFSPKILSCVFSCHIKMYAGKNKVIAEECRSFQYCNHVISVEARQDSKRQCSN